MPQIRFDTYYRYKELSSILQSYAQEFPNLVRLESIGKSYEGRDILVATLTNFETGEAEHKPAFWVDGNIHASEVSPSSACLYLITVWPPSMAPMRTSPAVWTLARFTFAPA
jgi:murein tripeptide amidase MpaA